MDYELETQKIVKCNEKYLKMFKDDLKKQGLTEKTIVNHLDNVYFYLNEYLAYYEFKSMEDGCRAISMYLGDFFIRKCMWSSVANIKSTAASIKKFYTYMLNEGFINDEDYAYLINTIKDEKALWIQAYNQYYQEFDDDDGDMIYS